MALGSVIRPGASIPQALAIPNRVGPIDAMVQTLGAYLSSLTFRVWGGEDVKDRDFQLVGVRANWPSPDVGMVYPSASIVEPTPTSYEAHSLNATALEETWGRFDHFIGLETRTTDDAAGKTCLWKEGEAVQQFQVDFWTDTEPDRQAIEAGLAAAFSPDPDGSAGVVVEGPELYYSLPIRFSLLSTKRDDSAASAGRGERRLRTVVRAECDIVSLRMATVMATPRVNVTVEDPSDPDPSIETED